MEGPDEGPDGGLEERDLLDRCRTGDRDAFDALFRRHYSSAMRFAAHISGSLDPEDVTAEAFARIWSALSGGGGPDGALGPYLRTTIRNVAINTATRNREATAEDEHIDFWMRRESRVADDGFSAAMAEHQLVADAFDTLPDRWRSVLWMVDVEGRRTSDVARHLGMTPNSTTALTKRARSALGQAWLQAHVNTRSSNPECEWVLEHIGKHTRRSLSAAQEERVRRHLRECDSCERASHRVAHLAVSLRIAAMIGGGSAAAMAAALLAEPTTAAAATHAVEPGGTESLGGTTGTDAAPGAAAAPGSRRVHATSRMAVGAAAAAAVVVGGIALAVIRPSSSGDQLAEPLVPPASPSASVTPNQPEATSTMAPTGSIQPTQSMNSPQPDESKGAVITLAPTPTASRTPVPTRTPTEAPQVWCRPYTGCGSRLRVA